MSTCYKCGNEIAYGDKFCRSCGAVLPAAQPETAEIPVQEPVAVIPAEPVVSTKTKVLGFVGMGLGIGGLVFGSLGCLYTLLGLLAEGVAGFVFSLIFGLFSVPMSIVGKILCNQSYEGGNPSSTCTVGSRLALAGIIVSGVMVFFGFIGLLISF